MVETATGFLKRIEERHKRQGFSDGYEALAVAHNWKEVFGTDLPDNYNHQRDFNKLTNAMLATDISRIFGEN